jgi:hypothetical protein
MRGRGSTNKPSPGLLHAKAWAEAYELVDLQLSPSGLKAIEALSLDSGDIVVDIGCGAGQTLLQLAERVETEGQVIGVDVAPVLLDIAKRRVEPLTIGFAMPILRELKAYGLAALIAFMTSAPSSAETLRRPELRGIEALAIYVPTSAAEAASAGACWFDRGALERRGAEILRGAGLTPLTTEERLVRSRANQQAIDRDLQALRAGRSPPSVEPEAAHRLDASLNLVRDLPTLSVRVAAGPMVGPDGGMSGCAAAVFAVLVAPARARPTVAANGVEVRAPLLLWRHSPPLVTAPAGDPGAAVNQTFDEAVEAFASAWRAANHR